MKRSSTLDGSLALAALLLAGSVLARQVPDDPRPAFIQRIKAVADAGKLSDPSAVSALLGIEFHDETSSATESCYQSTVQNTATTHQETAGVASWYRVTPTGVRNMPIPAFTINPASTSGDARLAYRIVKRSECPGDLGQRDKLEAALDFGGLPSFACFSLEDVERMLPSAKRVMATDGLFAEVYEGNKDDDSGTRLEFSFRFGAQCALSVSIRQSQMQGLRFDRATVKHDQCSERAQQDFCASHAPFGWNDQTPMSELQQAVSNSCGSVFRFYREDKEAGVRPPARSRWAGAIFPCGVARPNLPAR